MPYGSWYIPSGDAGITATLEKMAALADEGSTSPVVRNRAADIVLDAANDDSERAWLVGNWVADHTQFLPDPFNKEALVPAADALALIQARGVAQVDCDDVAILAASLGLSIGLGARFVVVDFGEGFAHVWAELTDPAGDGWLTVDPTRPTLELPPVVRSLIFEV